jgi:hypothetical protein
VVRSDGVVSTCQGILWCKIKAWDRPLFDRFSFGLQDGFQFPPRVRVVRL